MRGITVCFLVLFCVEAFGAGEEDKNEVFLVIDMQEEFLRHIDPLERKILIERVADRVREYTGSGSQVICVEMRTRFFQSSSTVPEIIELLSEPCTVVKESRSCSAALDKLFKENGLETPRKFIVCGVFTNHCIRESVEELSKESVVVVLEDCVQDTSLEEHQIGLRDLERLNPQRVHVQRSGMFLSASL